jgi:hypothetical protein
MSSYKDLTQTQEYSDDDEIEELVSNVPLADEVGRADHGIMVPTKQQVSDRLVEKLLDKQADEARRVPGRKLTSVEFEKVTRATEEELPEDRKKELDERIRIARRMNDKRNTYQKRLPNYKWRKDYDANKLTLDQLKQDEYELDIIINSQDVPTILKDGLLSACGWAEKLMVGLGFTQAQNFAEKVKINAQNKHFDSELEQLAIELKDYFALPPGKRLLFKTAVIFGKNVEENTTSKILGVQDPNRRRPVDDL